jgi:alpha-tubulin suppressor-like RCC1 family protein
VGAIERAVGIAAGFYHTCYLSTAGKVKCWGKGVDGQLGTGTRGTQLLPTEVTELENVIYIEAGESHTCALLADGTIKCWGDNYFGQLGGGEVGEFSSVPIEVALEK